MASKFTKDAVKAICATDPSINVTQVRAVLANLDGTGICEMRSEPPPRAYTRRQVAALLGVSPKAVTSYARRGLLVPIYTGAGGRRARSYTGTSVKALLSGKVLVKKA